uniref:Cadherin_C domain-containing protein n=1 Tax=Macrostomum lignano TaxID=282301 RepID=A0A1I8H442_9PLAT
MDSTGAASPELQSAVLVLLLACTLSCLSIMTGLCLCVRFKGLLHGRVKAPDPEAEVGAGRDGGGGGRSSCASSGNNNSSGLAKNGKLPPADWRRSGGNHENHSYYSRDAAGSDIYESAAPSAGEAAAAATTAARQDPRQSAIGRRLSGLRASFLARLRRSDLPGGQAATSATKKPTAAQRRPRLESQLSIRSQPADRELPPVPQQQPPLPPPPPQPPEAATGRSLLKRHLQDFPLPGIAHRLGFGRPASSAAAAPRPPGTRGIPCPQQRRHQRRLPEPTPRPGCPRPPRDLTSEIDPLYSAIRRHSGAGQDEPATATPTPVARRRHAVEPPQQQQHVYASICKTLPSSLNNTADSASSDAAAAAATAAPAEQSASSGGAGGGQPPPLPSRNYRREEVDRILQEPAAYYSNIDLDSAGSGGWPMGDAGANLRQQQQQPILRPILNDLRPGLAAAPADGEYQRVTVRESLASLRARNALPMTAGRPASAAAAATASQQRPLHLGGRLAGQAAAPEDSLYEDLYDAELRGAGGGLGDSYSDLYSEYNTDGLRESASNSMSSLVGAFGAPRVPPFRAAGRSPRDAWTSRRPPCALRDLRRLRRRSIASSSRRHRRRRSTDCLRRPCRYRPASRRARPRASAASRP